MLYSEFTKLAGFEVTESYYHNLIEPEYIHSTLDKQEWVKEWKKNGGIQKAYNYQKTIVENLKEQNDNQQEIVREARQKAYDYREKFEAVKQELFDAKNEIGVWKDNTEDLAYKLLEISEKTSSSDLRGLVISMIGFKAYIKYKFDNDMAIWQIDRDEIMKYI